MLDVCFAHCFRTYHESKLILSAGFGVGSNIGGINLKERDCRGRFGWTSSLALGGTEAVRSSSSSGRGDRAVVSDECKFEESDKF
jgi:hypothetical protein